jgi:hypothetical protein
MRVGTIFFLALSACASATVGTPESVRDRLISSETELAITAAARAGSITARRRSPDGWITGSVELTVERGELVVTADAHGAVTIERLAIDLGPIRIPRSVLGYEAQLTDVHLQAARPVGVVTTWTGDDEARATAELELELTWSLTINGEASPLGAPKLPPVPIELVLTGDGSAVHAEARARSTGTFWSWADLVKLEDLSLFFAAAMVSPQEPS